MISVIIPMYNSRDSVVPCIQSVIDQTYTGLITIIVVNDGSSDDSLSVVESNFIDLPPNRCLRVFNKENGGVSSARNLGIKNSRDEWIALLDSDDIWLPEKLDKQLAEIEKNPNIKFIGTNRNGEVYPFFRKKENAVFSLSAKQIIIKWYPHTSTALISKEVLLKTSLYDEARTHAEDGDLWLRLSEITDLWVLNEDLVFTGGGKRSFGHSGLSANMPKMFEGEVLALKSARNRKQINVFSYLLFYFWLTFKYLRRKFIVRFSKNVI